MGRTRKELQEIIFKTYDIATLKTFTKHLQKKSKLHKLRNINTFREI